MSGESELRLECVSNSSQPRVGNITTPSGLVLSPDNDTTIWRLNNPFNRFGVLRFRTLKNLTNDDMGVYTCMIPDDNDNILLLNVGLYRRNFTSEAVCCDLEELVCSLSCNSQTLQRLQI